jgi:DNA topoisomerase VI subunit B
VPLLYQQSACAIFKAVLDTSWRNYGVSQSRGALPGGPMVIFVHMASVWVPFTSESKEAIADYDEIRKEITLALRECGRRLGAFLRRRERADSEHRRRNIFELYIEEVVESCNRLKSGRLATEKLKAQLQKIAKARTGGEKTDEVLSKNGGAPEGLPHSIIVTPEGVEGEVPAPIAEASAGSSNGAGATVGSPNATAAEVASPNGAGHDAKSGRGPQRAAKAAGRVRGTHAKPAKRATRRKAGKR